MKTIQMSFQPRFRSIGHRSKNVTNCRTAWFNIKSCNSVQKRKELTIGYLVDSCNRIENRNMVEFMAKNKCHVDLYNDVIAGSWPSTLTENSS